MDDSDFYSLSMDDAPTAQEKARALAAALRQQSSVGLLGQISGDKVLSPLGTGLEQRAQQGQALLAQAGEKRVQRQTEAQHYAQLAQYHQQQVDNGAEALGIKQELADRHRAFNAKNGETLDYDPNTGEATTLRDAPPPKLLKGGRGSGAGAVANGTGGKQDDKDAKDFDARMSASGARAGAMGADYAKIANGQNLKTILESGHGVIPPSMVAEATGALGRLVTGGVVTEGTMEKMIPHTAGMDLASKLQYITGSPQDAGVKDFLDYMRHTADREISNSQQRIKTERLARIASFGGYYGRNKAAMARQAKAYGIEPGELDSVFGAVAVPAPGTAGAAAHPQADAARAWAVDALKANPKDPKALAIMARLTGG